ncbi:MAG: extracellular solute-binding protein [Candidatus Pacebacteria bacterium]|nr:extracellular solute-binding protein [Candidatus Paceibacterota bacterium]
MNNFQTILVAVFLAFFVFAVLIFSGAIPIGGISGGDGKATGKVVVWGTFPNPILKNSVDGIMSANRNVTVVYKKQNPVTYQQDLIEAFANNTGPDLFIITPDMIQKNMNFIYKIPYASYPEKLFTGSFIEGANIYLDKDGVIGMPLVVDPMVLYYNKDILTNEAIINPPQTWDELFVLNPKLTKRDNSGTISQSMIALGQYENVNNAKEIISTLMIQNGNPIVQRTDTGYLSLLSSNLSNFSVSPIESILKFYVEFSSPSNTAYSWNRSLPNSLDMFTQSKLAFYIGKSSELFNIQDINHNMSFDVTQILQIKDTTIKRTLGDIYAIVVNKKSTNLTSAFQIAGEMSQGESAKSISIESSLPPASKALLISEKPTGVGSNFLSTFFTSALITRSWLDPDRVKTDIIFSEMVENILSNRLSLGDSINKAQGQLDLLLKK